MGLSFTPTASSTIVRGFKDPKLMVPFIDDAFTYDHDDGQFFDNVSGFWDRVNELGQSTTSNFAVDTFQTIVDTTSGHRGHCYWIVGPQTPSTNVTITIRITVDGDTFTWAGVVAAAGDRVGLLSAFSSDVESGTVDGAYDWANQADGVRGSPTFGTFLPNPRECLNGGGPLIFDSQLKIEMKSSAGITTSIEKNAGALVAFWDDGWS